MQARRNIGRGLVAILAALGVGVLAPSMALAATADLALTKQGPASVAEGDAFTYIVMVSNAGPDPANDIVMIDRIPNRVELVGATSTQGSCAGQNRRIECRLGALGPGASARARIRVRAVQSGEAVNSARVSSADPDPQRENNRATLQTNITPAAPPATCAGKRATIVGTEGDDNLVGTDGRDVIVGLSGNDTIEGLRDRDLICGNGGADAIKSQGGNDLVRAGGGDDGVRTGGGNDQVRGGTDADGIFGGAGNDGLRGIGGNDLIRGKGGDDILRGGGGDDVLRGGGGANACAGGSGNDDKRSC